MIGAGLGGLAVGHATWRQGLPRHRRSTGSTAPAGAAPSITRDGHRFDLGPTIVTVPQVFEELWAACGRDFHNDVDLRPLDPFYEIRWPDGSTFTARQKTEDMRAEVAPPLARRS